MFSYTHLLRSMLHIRPRAHRYMCPRVVILSLSPLLYRRLPLRLWRTQRLDLDLADCHRAPTFCIRETTQSKGSTAKTDGQSWTISRDILRVLNQHINNNRTYQIRVQIHVKKNSQVDIPVTNDNLII